MDQATLSRVFLYIFGLGAGMAVLSKSRSRGVRQSTLLAISYALYITWGAWFLLVLLASTVANFVFGRWMRRTPRLSVLWTGLAFNLFLLAMFKYLPGAAVSLPFASLQKFTQIALPLGISFWTFQAMSYLLDVYRGDELDPSLLEFALYMAFFPVAISGPICRLPDILPQFRSDIAPSRYDIGRGLSRIATGVLMMQLAQLLAKGILAGQGVNGGFDPSVNLMGPDVWCLAFGYGLQIFFDFAGYSHIAIGAAQMLGFTVPENFARPYTSTTPSVFWTRWHMSLSFWIRDYVFLPLAMLRRDGWWRKLCLVIAMVLFGLWHKAAILFILFGCYHGVVLVLHRQVQQIERRFNWTPPAKLWTALSWIVTIALMNLGWIFFRANSLPQARRMFSALLSPATYASHTLDWSLYLLVAGLAIAYAATLYVIDYLNRYAEASSTSRSAVSAVAVGERWVWIAPMWAAACLLVLTLLPQHGRAANVFLYRSF